MASHQAAARAMATNPAPTTSQSRRSRITPGPRSRSRLPAAECDVPREQPHRMSRPPPAFQRHHFVDDEEPLEKVAKRIVGVILAVGLITVEALAAHDAPTPVEVVEERHVANESTARSQHPTH